MKSIESIKNSLIWIMLSFIVLLTGMCSEIERTDSSLLTLQHMVEIDTIEEVKNDTLYIGNCTNKLITGLKNTFQRVRRGQGRISLKNYAEFLHIKEILHMLSYVCIAALFVCQPTECSKTAILNYIHNQDGEK
ncbi:MAG: hypothetical protein IKL49_09320 [Lachnospiraceae bacterium]|nr:hypothetical protein [Lachnospiraceae bacterium]